MYTGLGLYRFLFYSFFSIIIIFNALVLNCYLVSANTQSSGTGIHIRNEQMVLERNVCKQIKVILEIIICSHPQSALFSIYAVMSHCSEYLRLKNQAASN